MVNKVENVDPREVQMLQHYLNEYGQQIEIFSQQFRMIEQGRLESLAAIESLSAITAADAGDGTVLLQIGGGASVRAHVVEPERVLVSIGAEVTVERTSADAVEFLKDRITEMEASGKKVAETVEKIRSQMDEISRRLDQVYRAAQQQAPQGQSGTL